MQGIVGFGRFTEGKNVRAIMFGARGLVNLQDFARRQWIIRRKSIVEERPVVVVELRCRESFPRFVFSDD